MAIQLSSFPGTQKTQTTISNKVKLSAFPTIKPVLITEPEEQPQKTNNILEWFGIEPDYLKNTKDVWTRTPIESIKEAGKSFVGGVKGAISSVKEKQKEYTTAIKTPGTPLSKKIATAVSGEVAVLSAWLSPISSAFEAAKELPQLREASTLLSAPFAITGKIGQFGADKFIDVLPVDQTTKDTLRPAFEEAGSLAGQVLLGGKIMNKISKGIKVDKKVIDETVKEVKIQEPEVAKAIKSKLVTDITKKTEPILSTISPTARKIKLSEYPTKIAPEAQKATKLGVSTEKGTLAQEARKPSEQMIKMAKDSPYRVSDFENYMSGQRFFHGSAENFDTFDISKIGKTHYSDWGKGISLAKYEDLAQSYKRSAIQGTKSKGFVKEFYIDPGAKIYEYYKKNPRDISPNLTDKLKKEGYDALYVYDELGRVEEAVVINPKVIYNPSQLTDFYNQSVRGERIPFQMAKPEGAKVSGVAKRIEATAVEKGLIEKGEELATYDPVKIKEQAQITSDLINSDIERATRVLSGKEELPQGMKGESLLSAMETYAMKTGDGKIIYELQKSPYASELSVAGQTMRLARGEENSPIRIIRELTKIKEGIVEKKFKGKTSQKIKQELNSTLRDKIKKSKPSKYSWDNFLREITC